MIRVQREGKQRISTDVVSPVDLGSASVAFSFPARGERPGTFTAGTWFAPAVLLSTGEYKREAITPRIGEAPLDLEPGHYRIFGKLTLGADEEVWEIDEEGLEVQ